LLNIRFCFVSTARDPGFCKLNTSFLNETEYINQIRTVIEKTHNEYLHDNTVNNALLWEMIKIGEHSIKYATANATIKYTAAKNIPGLLLFLDFEKAFDTLEWSSIQKTLRPFNFGSAITKGR